MATATFDHHIRPRPLLATPPQPLVKVRTLKSERLFYSSPLKANKLVSGVLECSLLIAAYLPPSQSSSASRTHFTPSTKLFVSGLSFRTTEESLRNAFKNFGELIEVNLVMDDIANRPRGFAFLRYATAEESEKAIEGMHGKFLDGRVIFVEVAKSRSGLPRRLKQKPGESWSDPSQ
ncbi:organelle RRM domain-containing protein 6, chloroplastic-like isoform X1 [Primulina huaijiensis]|uniref:organelle RRM domain-containing protein 6, chloroplastic-like isoform X1 n=1 Tax=Primulina huaijiensis TaxID=1492673 RepID=UPI003CC72C3B